MRTFDEYQQRVNASLQVVLDSFPDCPDQLKEAMNYSLLAGGKRLRPCLLLAACEAAGGNPDDALPYAWALEMIHTYSLIHDDLPAMDNDDLRRGKPTNHVVFGEGKAVLAGDGLLSAAFELLLRDTVRHMGMRGAAAGLAIARGCGISGMVAGQMWDIRSYQETDGDAGVWVRRTTDGKTAALFVAAMEAGFLLAGATENEVSSARAYGLALGRAFQIVDDILDVTGSAAEMGKNTDVDSTLGKTTWVSVYGLDGASAKAEEQISAAKMALASFPGDVQFFEELADKLLERSC